MRGGASDEENAGFMVVMIERWTLMMERGMNMNVKGTDECNARYVRMPMNAEFDACVWRK